MSNQPDAGVSAALELVPGFLIQTFGIGHMYSGSIAKGLIIMFSYWALQFVNAMLMFVLVGFVTAPLTWIAFMIFSPLNAASTAKRPRGYLT